MEPVQVAAAIIEDGGRILIGRRQAGGSCSLLWEFPGGKLEPGETPEACLLREVKEELNIDIAGLRPYGTANHVYAGGPMHFYFYRAVIAAGTPQCRVHRTLLWVKKQDLGRFPFCPADIEIINRLLREDEAAQ